MKKLSRLALMPLLLAVLLIGRWVIYYAVVFEEAADTQVVPEHISKDWPSASLPPGARNLVQGQTPSGQHQLVYFTIGSRQDITDFYSPLPPATTVSGEIIRALERLPEPVVPPGNTAESANKPESGDSEDPLRGALLQGEATFWTDGDGTYILLPSGAVYGWREHATR